ncbi:uncharacterized protein LOC131009326 [Salvia miltiorrhiza]|uniref:uncharacterized protein LOC131009326 n=1 Tax=Salvia miltiorrhiza TaxID=226208 RepID=UPI0025AC2822|nr:uncharacterized protein LOC131009326 [Salvia miltiorrhiza]
MDRLRKHFEDYDDWSEYRYVKSLNLIMRYVSVNGWSIPEEAESSVEGEWKTENERPPPHVERQQNVRDTKIKCFFCMKWTQTAGEHQMSVLPCGIVFGYSCMKESLLTKKESCPMCGLNHSSWEATQLDITPEQMPE